MYCNLYSDVREMNITKQRKGLYIHAWNKRVYWWEGNFKKPSSEGKIRRNSACNNAEGLTLHKNLPPKFTFSVLFL